MFLLRNKKNVMWIPSFIWSSKLQIGGGSHIIFLLFFEENLCCGYSLEAPHQGTSNEYPQLMFLWRNKKDISIFWLKKAPYLLLWSKLCFWFKEIYYPKL